MDSLVEYIVSVGGKSRKVRLLKVNHKGTALIELDDKVFEVIFSNSLCFDKQVSISVDGKKHRIRLSKDKSTVLNSEVNGKKFVLQLQAKRRELGNKTFTPLISFSYMPRREKLVVKESGAVTSLMPGKVVLLKVEVGDKVKAGDPLCVLEAMKMENEIVAPKDGIIAKVKVDQGSIVDKGDVLVVIGKH